MSLLDAVPCTVAATLAHLMETVLSVAEQYYSTLSLLQRDA
jgi:hypothetical protein